MPKVVGFTPPWLSRPSPGDRIFSDPGQQSPASPSKNQISTRKSAGISEDYYGPKRLLATRGTEIFVVVGNKIRWADLLKVRDDWEESNNTTRSRGSESGKNGEHQSDAVSYRTLTAPVYYEIRQLVISPSGTFLAICTEHTVHIAVLPDSSRLSDKDRSPLKLKTHQLGPTTHVIPESPLASVIWHPFAVSTSSTDCLITVTAEAVVRLWEIDRSNHWSFERPALAIDLRKLVDGVSSDQDFEPSGFGKNRAFSADEFDMAASAACFGGKGRLEEDPWASMTLWIAMTNGSVYALCPLLPTKWQPSSTTIPALSTSAIARMATIAEDEAKADDRRAADQHYEWVQELDNEEPIYLDDSSCPDSIEVRLRPQNPSAIPRLQGPFEIEFNEDEDIPEISDIHAYPTRLDDYELLSGEDDYDDFDTDVISGAPFTLLCLATTGNKVIIAMEPEGVSGQWLPRKGRSTFSVHDSEIKDLVLVDSVNLDSDETKDSQFGWPMITSDPLHDHAVFVTTTSSIHSISLDDWVSRIAAEFTTADQPDTGLSTRLDTSCQSRITLTSKITSASKKDSETLSAPVILDNPELGYFLLCSSLFAAYSAFLDKPQSLTSTLYTSQSESFLRSSSGVRQDLLKLQDDGSSEVEKLPTRAPYVPADVLYANPTFPIEQVRQKLGSQQKRALIEKPMRLSPACLDIMAQTHRNVSKQTTEMQSAAAELFRKCTRIQEELRDQVKLMSELADRLRQLTAPTDADGNESKTHDERISSAKEKQKKLSERYESLRRKIGRSGVRKQELSEKEIRWIEEITKLNSEAGLQQGQNSSGAITARYDTVKNLVEELVTEVRKIDVKIQDDSRTSSRTERSDSPATRKSGLSVSSRLQREKVAEIMSLVEREGVVIDAAMAKLERLQLNVT